MRRDLFPPTVTSVNLGELAGTVTRFAVSRDGRTAACCTEEDGSRGIQFWDLVDRRRLGTVPGHEGSIYGLAFSPDGRWLASTSVDTKVKIWNVAKRRLHELLQGHSGLLYSTVFSSDGRRLAAAAQDGTMRLWKAPTIVEIEKKAELAKNR